MGITIGGVTVDTFIGRSLVFNRHIGKYSNSPSNAYVYEGTADDLRCATVKLT